MFFKDLVTVRQRLGKLSIPLDSVKGVFFSLGPVPRSAAFLFPPIGASPTQTSRLAWDLLVSALVTVPR